jgi:hypothetical protein
MIDIRELAATAPKLHGETTHGLVAAALEWIDQRPRPQRTLETGCGLSTLVFIGRGDEHVCITPNADEPARVRAYCEEHDLDAGGVTFLIEPSEVVLPSLQVEPLDLVLIDGSHAFPNVFIDYFYASRLLAVGASLVIDDIHLWTGSVLKDFLLAEPEWALVKEWDGRTVAFRKLQDPRVCDWFDQPFVMQRSTPWRMRARMAASLVGQRDFATLANCARAMRQR